MKVSILITSYKRAPLLRWGLYSLSRQKITYEFETIVLNDNGEDETEMVCKEYEDKLNIKYIRTGKNHPDCYTWRVPGFAFNIGAKQSTGDILILSCAEMFHLNSTIDALTYPFSENKKLMTLTSQHGLWDDDGRFIKSLNSNFQEYETISEEGITIKNGILNNMRLVQRHYLPFLMGVSREIFFDIGGYDEDFRGYCWDDDDLIGRLADYGCVRRDTEAKAIHLYHCRSKGVSNQTKINRVNMNRKLYNDRKGIVCRNIGREWGKYDY